MLSSCVIFSTPANNAGFAPIHSPRDLEGVWKNLGESGLLTSDHRLSEVIWPTAKIEHSAIVTIDVKAITDNQLRVRALSATGVAYESTFAEGNDFRIEGGRIVLRRRMDLLTEVSIGPVYEEIEIGLDQRGDGKWQDDYALAGLVMVVPMVAVGREEVRFVRISR